MSFDFFKDEHFSEAYEAHAGFTWKYPQLAVENCIEQDMLLRNHDVLKTHWNSYCHRIINESRKKYDFTISEGNKERACVSISSAEGLFYTFLIMPLYHALKDWRQIQIDRHILDFSADIPLDTMRDEGGWKKDYSRSEYPFYYKTDLKNFYNSIDHEKLKNRIMKLLPDYPADLLLQWLRSLGHERTGVPQSFLASDLLAEIYLTELDLYLIEKELKFSRLSDNFRIYGSTEKECQDKGRELNNFIREQGLESQSEKSEVAENYDNKKTFGFFKRRTGISKLVRDTDFFAHPKEAFVLLQLMYYKNPKKARSYAVRFLNEVQENSYFEYLVLKWLSIHPEIGKRNIENLLCFKARRPGIHKIHLSAILHFLGIRNINCLQDLPQNSTEQLWYMDMLHDKFNEDNFEEKYIQKYLNDA